MFIDKMLIDMVELFYDGLTTLYERQDYQERCARELQTKHAEKIRLYGNEPIFYIDRVESGLNNFKFEPPWEVIIKNIHPLKSLRELQLMIEKIYTSPSYLSSEQHSKK